MPRNKTDRARARRFSVYVIQLDPAVLRSRGFREANPARDPRKASLYVGMTARTPEERFAQHRAGYKSCRYVRRYGKWLRRRMFQHYNPMTWEEAKRTERELARRLRAQGYAVWQN